VKGTRVPQSLMFALAFLTFLLPLGQASAGAAVDASDIFLEGRLFNSGGNGVSNLAVADLNGDGKLDIVAANTCVSGSLCGAGVAGSVGVVIGNGDGTYQPAVIYYSYATVVASVAIADVNGDGKPDVLVGGTCTSGVCATEEVISVLLGNGDGTFRQGGYFASTSGAGALAVGDLNGDGKADVVSVGGSVGVMLGNGDGTFQPQVVYNSGGSGANDVVIADVNGDGKPDLVVSNQNVALLSADGGVGVLLGNGDGTFQTAVSYDAGAMQSYSVAVMDLNGDHHPDIVVTTLYAANAYNNDYADGSVGVLLGNGDGSFQPVVNYYSGGGQTYGVAIADLNGDGKPDLLVANASVGKGSGGTDNALGVLLGNGDGTFQQATSYATGAIGGFSVVVADMNGDGKADALITEQYPNPGGPAVVGVVLGNGDGSFRAPVIYASATYADNTIAAVDVNGDGKLDLVIAAQGVSCTGCVGGVSVMLGNGNGTFQSPVAYGTGTTNPTDSVAVADLNGDGKSDIVAASSCISNVSCVSSVAVLLNNGDGTFKAAVNYATNGQAVHSVAIGDVNGDGKPDIVVANFCASGDFYCVSGTVGVLLGNGDGTFRPVIIYGTGGQHPTAVALGDLNDDGKPDIVVSNYQTTSGDYTGRIGVLLGNGDGTFQPATTYLSGGIANNSVTIVDLDGDGKLDLIAVNQGATSGQSTGTLGVLLGNGDGTFRTAIVTSTTRLSVDYFAQVAIADFNGDGKIDVACGASDFLLLGNGDGTFQPVSPLGFEGTGIAAGDFNIDGRPDLAVGGVAILLNISPGFGQNTTTSLASSLNPSAYGQKVTFTATVAPLSSGTPTGTVSFKDGAANLGTVSLSSGSGSLSSSTLSAGSLSITASYSGDSNFSPSTSAALIQSVNKATTTAAVVSNASPSYLNQSVTFTATVKSPYGGAIAGTVTFKQGTILLSTVALTKGQATYSTTYTTTGTRSITATYSGDTNDLGSTSAALSQTVNALPAATTTKVATSGSPTYINQPAIFTATVTSTYGPIPNGETVTFYDGTNIMGTGFTTNGASTFSTSTLAARSHTIKATYAGDGTFKSSSGSVTQVVNLYASSTSLPTSSLNPFNYGQAVTLTAIVTSTSPSAPTGTVVFKNGTTWLASGTVSSTGVATATTRTLPAGSLSITAAYNGDSETAKSTSAPLSQTVAQTTSATTLKSSLNPSLSGQTVTFTATVTSPTTTPTGTVTFMDGNTILGTNTLSAGKTAYSTASLTSGSHSISAVYAGTANIKGSSAAVLVQNVN
jgi:hypothetical protein